MNRAVMFTILTLAAIAVVGLVGCSREVPKPSSKLQVVTTLFPLYDFARTIPGDRAEVTMLLPPGMEPHSFEPKPNDVIRISNAGLFIYTNPYMEPWAATIIKSIDRQQLRVVRHQAGNKPKPNPLTTTWWMLKSKKSRKPTRPDNRSMMKRKPGADPGFPLWFLCSSFTDIY